MPVVMQNWSVCEAPGGNPFIAPERRAKKLQGLVYGHPEFPDGSQIMTSDIVEHDYANKTVRTRNTVYTLGKIDPGFVQYMRDYGIRPVTFRPEDFQRAHKIKWPVLLWPTNFLKLSGL